MNKRILAVLVVLSVFFVTACGTVGNQVGNNDWTYRLPNDYAIWHINSIEILCVKQSNLHNASTVVDKYVLDFCYNDEFVCLKCVGIPDDINEKIDDSNPLYYIVNTENDDLYGELSEEEYLLKIQELSITDLSDWIPTKPRPDGAVFN